MVTPEPVEKTSFQFLSFDFLKGVAMRKFALLALSLLVGCAGTGGFGPSGAYPGTIMNATTYPSENFSSTSYQFGKNDFQILGSVTAEAASSSILGIIASGDSGYVKLYDEAKKQHSADDVICVKVDTFYYNILGIISKVKTKLHGVAIKWTKK